MNRKKYLFYFTLFIIPVVVGVIHNYYTKPAIEAAFNNHPDYFLSKIIDFFYPRFIIEKNRFSLSFFLQKADQVTIRFIVVYLMGVLFYLFCLTNRKSKDKIYSLSFVTTTINNIRFIRIAVSMYFFIIQYGLIQGLLHKHTMIEFYKPLLWLKLLSMPFPSITGIYIIGGLWIIANTFILLNIKKYYFSILNVLLFILIQSWFFSFEKIDHGFSTLTLALLIFPFLLTEVTENQTNVQSWPLQLIRIGIASVYLLSGLEKLFIAQLSWLKPSNLKTYLSFHETPLSILIAQYDSLCILISLGALLFQLSFIYIVYNPRVKWIWLISGVLFHTGTYFIMGIGHPLNPWIVVYIFFIDWTDVYSYFSNRLSVFHFLSK